MHGQELLMNTIRFQALRLFEYENTICI